MRHDSGTAAHRHGEQRQKQGYNDDAAQIRRGSMVDVCTEKSAAQRGTEADLFLESPPPLGNQIVARIHLPPVGHLPGLPARLIRFGYHQADNIQFLEMRPLGQLFYAVPVTVPGDEIHLRKERVGM